MAKMKTTTKDFKAGLKVDGSNPTIEWESTGHLAVRLSDELGQAPLAGKTVKVTIPGEGAVELITDDDGVIKHPDVPFQDYELDLGDAKVHVPAVANPDDVHDRHVPGIFLGFVAMYVTDEAGDPVAETKLRLEGPQTLEVTTDRAGLVSRDGPLPPGTYRITSERGRAELTLSARGGGLAIVTLVGEGSR
jgi:hypothetical protein